MAGVRSDQRGRRLNWEEGVGAPRARMAFSEFDVGGGGGGSEETFGRVNLKDDEFSGLIGNIGQIMGSLLSSPESWLCHQIVFEEAVAAGVRAI